MHFRLRRATLCLLLATAAVAAQDSAVGRVNTLWVVPTEQFAWVDPMSVKLMPGGGLYLILANARMRDLRESADNAFGYLRDHPEICPGFAEGWKKHDLWISIGDDEQPRGGPSAGVAFALSAYSALADIPIRTDFAVTGEVVRADGSVLGVGGIEYKLEAVQRYGIRTFCLPADGAPTLDRISVALASAVRLVTIRHIPDAFFEAFGYDGPDAERYDRIMTLWRRAREAMTRRNAAQARLALDELVEIAPTDLSARRLQLLYREVDMRAAAENLFADAAQLERDGLPDMALGTARRAWAYADAATRETYGPLLRRLELNHLDPAARALVARAEEQARAEQVGEAWRTLQSARQVAPDNPYLAAYAAAWQPYEAVARLEAALAGRGDDVAALIAVARALEEARAWTAAGRRWAQVRAAEPDNARWLPAEVHAYANGRRLDLAADALRQAAENRPAEAAALCAELEIELEPPSLDLGALELTSRNAAVIARTVDPSGLPELTATVDGGPTAALRASPARISVDLGLLSAGEHELRIVSRDKFGNEATTTLTLTAPDDGPPTCLRVLEAPAGLTPDRVVLRPGRTIAPLGSTLILDALLGLGDRLPSLRAFRAGDTEVSGPPWRLELPTAGREAGDQPIEIVGLDRDGIEHRAVADLTLTAEPPVWISSPSDGERLDGTVSVVVGCREELDAAAVVLLLDGWPHRIAAPAERLTLTADPLPAGEHTLQAEVILADGGAMASPSITVIVARAVPEPQPGADWPPLATSSLAGLALDRLPAVPGLMAYPSEPNVRIERITAAPPPQSPPDPADTALRLYDGPLPARLVVSVGDALAFRDAPADGLLGPHPVLRPGPLATSVWLPDAPGLYPLVIGDQAVLVEVVSRPALRVCDPPSGAAPTTAMRLRLYVAEAARLGEVTLLSGDSALGRWPVPLPDLWIDPLLLPAGDHVLRLAATDDDGAVHISPAVVWRVE